MGTLSFPVHTGVGCVLGYGSMMKFPICCISMVAAELGLLFGIYDYDFSWIGVERLGSVVLGG
ncbi:hypothetical protein BDV28DRAFT_143864 [Aspergillus coremiiformis]|uniref:Uncharacterized protein n=1 Tax=Aspergillus coremiiformis TaxID=138285 RepID=A0A5N6YTQ9_9EURO|nr:hypothetical protein BDV28DRAFT_143864 [Aspergillus coremiiformis]